MWYERSSGQWELSTEGIPDAHQMLIIRVITLLYYTHYCKRIYQHSLDFFYHIGLFTDISRIFRYQYFQSRYLVNNLRYHFRIIICIPTKVYIIQFNKFV
jgi:hypothetical protein